jgi:hypothetical protein
VVLPVLANAAACVRGVIFEAGRRDYGSWRAGRGHCDFRTFAVILVATACVFKLQVKELGFEVSWRVPGAGGMVSGRR